MTSSSSSLYLTNQKAYDFQDFEDDDEEDASDDEVFVNDRKRGGLDDDSGVSKPLMAPRRKLKTNKLHTEVRRGNVCRTVCVPVCCALTAIASLVAIICLVVFLVSTFASRFRVPEMRYNRNSKELVGCSHFVVTDVWTQNFPQLITESAIRLNDLNGDGTLDIVIGFGTGADGYEVPDVVCDVYFGGTKPCFGGLLALDGKSGVEIWRRYMDHEVFAVNCNVDLNGDTVLDCIGAGRAGVLQAVNGKTGETIWNFGDQEAKNRIMNVYTPQYISDQDGDGVEDIVVIHGGDPLADPGSKYRLAGRIIILSGHNGKVLQWDSVPDKRESYYSLQFLNHPDGTQFLLFGTGGETHGGGLWAITLNDLLKKDMQKARPIYEDSRKGIMTPPVIVDVNGDGVEDVVMAMFNSTVVAFNGLNFEQLWNHTIPMSETYSTPAVGFFNDDDIPDFLIKYQIGPGFPIYYYSETTILDGRDGQPLLSKAIRDTVGAQTSGLTIGMEGYGNDVFLYWTADCQGHEGEGREFTFTKGTNIHEQSRSDFCGLRYNTELISRSFALNQHIREPGFPVYISNERKSLEYNNSVNTSKMAQDFIKNHPDIVSQYRQPVANSDADGVAVNGYNGQSENRPVSELHHGIAPAGHRRQGGNARYGVKEHHPNADIEYKEDVWYPKVHSIRKHGRYKTGSNGHPQAGLASYDTERMPIDELQQRTRARWPNSGDVTDNEGAGQTWYGENQDSDLGVLSDQYGDNNRYPSGRIRYDPPPPRDEYDLFGANDPYSTMEEKQRYLAENDRNGAEYPQPEPNWMPPGSNYGNHYKKSINRLKRTLARRKAKFPFIKSERTKRHVGPHDMDGIQRLISTGALAPVLDTNVTDANYSMDYVFATYWFFPANTQAIMPEDRDCIQAHMAQQQERFKPESRYYGMDSDAYEATITTTCMEKNGHRRNEHRTYESQSSYDPFDIHMGQMTVYRLHIKCSCEGDMRVEQGGRPCARVLPFDKQKWAGYMGTKGDSHT